MKHKCKGIMLRDGTLSNECKFCLKIIPPKPKSKAGRKPSPFGRSVRVYVPILLREEFRAWLRERIGLDKPIPPKVD